MMRPLGTFGIALIALQLLTVARPAEAAAVTVDNSGTTVALAAKLTAQYRYVVIKNQSAIATLACTDDGSTPAIGAAGSYDAPPGVSLTWGPGANGGPVFGGPFKCISSAASSPASVTAR